VPTAAPVPPRTPYAAAGQRRGGAGRRAAVPGDWLLGTGAIPPAEKDSRGQGRGFLAAAVAGHGVLGRARGVAGSDRSLLVTLRLARGLGLAFISYVQMACSFLVYLTCWIW
jgi:hypothetical protein